MSRTDKRTLAKTPEMRARISAKLTGIKRGSPTFAHRLKQRIAMLRRRR